MRLKSFYAADLPQAMKLVREELGPEAIILSNQPCERSSGIRVTAALEDAPLDDLSGSVGEDGLGSVDEISAALAYHRVPAGLCDRLLAAAASLAAEDSELALAGALDVVFSFSSKSLPPMERPLMLVGPPGAGKTATAAKLCALARLEDRSADLVTMDTVKAGGLAQAATFAEAMRVTLHEAGDEESVAQAVKACPDGGFVVVDTVGANPFDPGEWSLLNRTAEAIAADMALVLPAGGDALESADLALAFSETGASLICVTRIDAARRLGGPLAAAGAADLAFLAAGVSPHVSGGLAAMRPVALARNLLVSRDGSAPPAQTIGFLR